MTLRRLTLGLGSLALVLPLGLTSAPAGAAQPQPLQLLCSDPGALRPGLAATASVPTLDGLSDKASVKLRHLVSAGSAAGLPSRAQAIAVAAWLGSHDRHVAQARLGTGWGTLAFADFYDRLRKVDDWRVLSPSVVAHQVLGTPDPYVFDPYWSQALSVLGQLTGHSALEVGSEISTGGGLGIKCYADATDARAFPLPAGTGYSLVVPGSREGKDADPTSGSSALIDAPCGTPVLAAASGVVTVRQDVRDSGPWLVTIAQDGGLTTTYAHIGKPLVTSGSPIVVGQQLATVADYGHIGRCTLGFGLVKDNAALTSVDTVAWLAKAAQPKVLAAVPTDTLFRMASLNVLGSHLSEPGAKDAGYAPGPVRMKGALAMLDRAQASIVTMQEFETPAADVVHADPDWGLIRATPNNTFRGGNTNGNAIAWRKDVWDYVSSTEFTVPWRITLHMPVVLLRNKQTQGEIVVVGVHNPATTHNQGDQSAARTVARNIEITQVKAIAAQTKLPVIISGDFNEHAPVTCAFTQAGLMVWPNGGSCAAASHGGVDHIFGYGALSIQDLYVDRSPQGSITDHPVVYSDIQLPVQRH